MITKTSFTYISSIDIKKSFFTMLSTGSGQSYYEANLKEISTLSSITFMISTKSKSNGWPSL